MPQMVIDICRQHHGTTLMKFFYVKAKERNPEIKESDFRYPGPRPQTREAGIVSIADTCEVLCGRWIIPPTKNSSLCA